MSGVRAQTLYDAALNTLPAQQGWSYLALPGTASQSLVDAAARLDTSALMAEQAGYSRTAPGLLDRQAGFTLLLTLRLHQEAHGNNNRAGFSMIVLGHDRRGIELGFWTNRVFAQTDVPLFTHGEDATLVPATGAVDYVLTIVGDHYQLRAEDRPVLEGPLRDYTPFVGLIDPYETPDFVFLGDDTTSASATVSLANVTLVPAPRLQVEPGGVIAWAGVAGVTYTVEGSADFGKWTRISTVTPTSDRCAITNLAALPALFIRVRGP